MFNSYEKKEQGYGLQNKTKKKIYTSLIHTRITKCHIIFYIITRKIILSKYIKIKTAGKKRKNMGKCINMHVWIFT